ncbi:MAG: zinc ribbon domain-containing protein [Thermoplasmata archaeon]|nr:zinc ribbon domain-containing protein [Thermoplasmata archaeon]
MVHTAAVLVGLAIVGVGLAIFATGGHLGPLDVGSLTSGVCGGFPCPYTSGAVGGIIVIAGLGYLVRGLTAPTTPSIPAMMAGMPPWMAAGGMPPQGMMREGSPPPTGQNPAPVASGGPDPTVFCSACGSRNKPDAAFCFKCGKAISRG